MNKSHKLTREDSNRNRNEEDEDQENLSDYEKKFNIMRADSKNNSRRLDNRSLEGVPRTLNNTRETEEVDIPDEDSYQDEINESSKNRLGMNNSNYIQHPDGQEDYQEDYQEERSDSAEGSQEGVDDDDDDNENDQELVADSEQFRAENYQRNHEMQMYISNNRLNGQARLYYPQETPNIKNKVPSIEEQTPLSGYDTNRPLVAESQRHTQDDALGDEDNIFVTNSDSKKRMEGSNNSGAIIFPEEEQCQLGECTEKSIYVCRAFYCCDEYGCERRFCSKHRSKRCFINDSHEPWPTVCLECEVKVSRCGWIRCLVPSIAVPIVAIVLMVLVGG